METLDSTVRTLPIHSYTQALAFLAALDVSVMKLGLSRMTGVMARLGNPQDDLPMVHVAGTNGKGSVSAMLAGIFNHAGYPTGLFTSPHLRDVREVLGGLTLESEAAAAGHDRAFPGVGVPRERDRALR